MIGWTLLACALPEMPPLPPVAWQADCLTVNCVDEDERTSHEGVEICRWDCADIGDGRASAVAVTFERGDECGCWVVANFVVDYPDCSE